MVRSETAVLIITEPDDVHGHALTWALNRAGVRCDRWSLSEYPERQQTSVRISDSPLSPTVRIPGLCEDYRSIWLRRLAEPQAISPSLAAADVPMATLQARRSSEGIRSIFSLDAVWINPLRSRAEANAKPVQLLAARKAGFAIPETLISNDPDEIRRFCREHGGEVICKFFTPAFWRSQTDGVLRGLFTSRLSEELLENGPAFTSCPAIYQPLVAKKADVRVTFFGGTYYAVRIRSQESSSGAVDFRSDILFESPMERMELNGGFLDHCMELSSNLGLLHGSYDFIERPDGSLTFLEVNEMGQFLWLEESVPELPLLSAFAAFSLEPRRDFRFESGRWPHHSFDEFMQSEAFAMLNQPVDPATAGGPFHFRE
jgi:glutathione synthase/RimK-type ligase-like ATP-grasp enzyme